MATCNKCGKVSEETAKVLSLCVECIRKANKKSLAELAEVCPYVRKADRRPVENRGQRTEDRGQRTEDRRQRTENLTSDILLLTSAPPCFLACTCVCLDTGGAGTGAKARTGAPKKQEF